MASDCVLVLGWCVRFDPHCVLDRAAAAGQEGLASDRARGVHRHRHR